MTERDSIREREIEQRARELFAESVAGLDGHTRSRLSQARAAAIAATGKRPAASWLARWRPASPWRAFGALLPAGVAVAVVALAATFLVPQMQDAPAAPVVLNDLDLLLEGENLDFFEELEFYAWLLEQPDLLGDDNG
jgi:hypothetical protein